LEYRKGFLQPYDVLVLDNASIHCKGDSISLDEYLWINHKIFLLYLPTRSPELNPIELMWRLLLQRMRIVRQNMNGWGDIAKEACAAIMDGFTHEDVYHSYRACGVIM